MLLLAALSGNVKGKVVIPCVASKCLQEEGDRLEMSDKRTTGEHPTPEKVLLPLQKVLLPTTTKSVVTYHYKRIHTSGKWNIALKDVHNMQQEP